MYKLPYCVPYQKRDEKKTMIKFPYRTFQQGLPTNKKF